MSNGSTPLTSSTKLPVFDGLQRAIREQERTTATVAQFLQEQSRSASLVAQLNTAAGLGKSTFGAGAAAAFAGTQLPKIRAELGAVMSASAMASAAYSGSMKSFMGDSSVLRSMKEVGSMTAAQLAFNAKGMAGLTVAEAAYRGHLDARFTGPEMAWRKQLKEFASGAGGTSALARDYAASMPSVSAMFTAAGRVGDRSGVGGASLAGLYGTQLADLQRELGQLGSRLGSPGGRSATYFASGLEVLRAGYSQATDGPVDALGRLDSAVHSVPALAAAVDQVMDAARVRRGLGFNYEGVKDTLIDLNEVLADPEIERVVLEPIQEVQALADLRDDVIVLPNVLGLARRLSQVRVSTLGLVCGFALGSIYAVLHYANGEPLPIVGLDGFAAGAAMYGAVHWLDAPEGE